MSASTPSFEQGPIRPPSEAHSLLVRVIRNCTWNRCTFCPVYKGSGSSLRALEDVLADVDAMAAAAEVLEERGAGAIHGGLVPQEAYQVALFLRGGGRTVFLQDADPCAVKPEKLAAVIRRVRERFPAVERVTTYGRAATLARRTAEQLALLVDAGLTRVHLGLESGADEVLMAIDKGCTSGDLIGAGENVVRAGLELCFYLMPGLGGRAAAAAHVAGSARVIRAVAATAPAARWPPGAARRRSAGHTRRTAAPASPGAAGAVHLGAAGPMRAMYLIIARPMNWEPISVARSSASGAPSVWVMGPKTRRPRYSRTSVMAVSLVIAERTIATRGLRLSGGSYASRKARTLVAPMSLTSRDMTRLRTSPGSTGTWSAAPNSCSLDPK